VEQAIVLASGSLCYTTDSASFTFSPTHHRSSHHVLGEASAGGAISEVESGTGQERALPGLAKAPDVQTITDPTWICEMSLLAEWETVGTLEAITTSELLLVSAESFIKLVRQSAVMAAVVSCYAAQLCDALAWNARHYGWVGLPTDVDLRVDCDVVIAKLHNVVRSDLISLPVLEILRKQKNMLSSMLQSWNISDLEEEVVAGKCHLISAPTPGMVYRVVQLVVLRITNLDGLLCVQLAEKRGDHYSPKFHLPGRKVEGNALPSDVVRKLLEDDFKDIARHIKLEDVDTVVESQDSHSFGLKTKYIKFVQNAVLVARMEPTLRATRTDVADFQSETGRARHGAAGQIFAKKSVQSSFQDSLESVCLRPFTAQGMSHCFGVEQEHQRHHHHIKFYKWLNSSDFDTLQAHRQEVEVELMGYLLNGLSAERLDGLTHWQFNKEVSEAEVRAAELVSGSHHIFPQPGSEQMTSAPAAAFAAASFHHPESFDSGVPSSWADDELWGAAV